MPLDGDFLWGKFLKNLEKDPKIDRKSGKNPFLIYYYNAASVTKVLQIKWKI